VPCHLGLNAKCTWLATFDRWRCPDRLADTGAMPKRPFPCEFEPMPLPAWSIYKLAAKRQWLGIVEAPDAKAAIEAAAREFKTDARRLLAVW
jgi:hypothetical protein